MIYSINIIDEIDRPSIISGYYRLKKDNNIALNALYRF